MWQKHPWLIALALSGAFLAHGCKKSPPPKPVPPREQLRQELGLVLPDTAVNVRCHSEGLMVWFVYARFDIPASDLPELLSTPPLDRLPPLAKNADVVQRLQTGGINPSWMTILSSQSVTAAEAVWAKSGPPREWHSELYVAVQQKEDVVTVFLMHVDEPGRAPTQTTQPGITSPMGMEHVGRRPAMIPEPQ